MDHKKEIKLVLDMTHERDRNIYNSINEFGRKHGIHEESEALKSFMMHLNFLVSDIELIHEKLRQVA